jgi:hypothetical protein
MYSIPSKTLRNKHGRRLDSKPRKKTSSYAINVDSKSTLLAIANKHKTHPLASAARLRTIKLRNFTSITFHWVKEHTGLKGNERANYLPQTFPSSQAQLPPHSFLTNHGSFRSYLHKTNKMPSQNCNCLEKAKQTARHLLLECSIFSKDRPPVLKSLPPPLVLKYHINTVGITRFLRSIFNALQEESTRN